MENIEYIIAIIALFCILCRLCLYQTKEPMLLWKYNPHPSNNFGEASPKKRYKDVVKEFGKADYVDGQKEDMQFGIKIH